MTRDIVKLLELEQRGRFLDALYRYQQKQLELYKWQILRRKAIAWLGLGIVAALVLLAVESGSR